MKGFGGFKNWSKKFTPSLNTLDHSILHDCRQMLIITIDPIELNYYSHCLGTRIYFSIRSETYSGNLRIPRNIVQTFLSEEKKLPGKYRDHALNEIARSSVNSNSCVIS